MNDYFVYRHHKNYIKYTYMHTSIHISQLINYNNSINQKYLILTPWHESAAPHRYRRSRRSRRRHGSGCVRAGEHRAGTTAATAWRRDHMHYYMNMTPPTFDASGSKCWWGLIHVILCCRG